MVDVIGPKLAALGSRLRDMRLLVEESQEMFASRLGIGVVTMRRMEKGDPTVAIGYWANALGMLDRAG